MHVLRGMDRRRFAMDFMVHSAEPAPYDAEIQALGGKVIAAAWPRHIWKYARSVRSLLQRHGPYDVFDCHVEHCGYLLRIARRAGIPVRIAHSHNDWQQYRPKGLLDRLFISWTNRWIPANATHGLGVSRRATSALFGQQWEADPRWQVLQTGIDLAPFRKRVDRAAVRARLGIPGSAFVVGHVGRFAEAKNHAFLIEIARALAVREPAFRLLLVGDGPLRPAIEERVARAGLTGKVIFAGARADVADLLLGAIDVFVFPSLYEGLANALVEAQAAGLPCVISSAIPEEADVVAPLVRRLGLAEPPEAWASAALLARTRCKAIPQEECAGIIERSEFNIDTHIERLQEFYTNSLPNGEARGA